MSTVIQPKLPTAKGPNERFTGDVYFNSYFAGDGPSHARLNLVRFTPGAHTAWHRHAVGQTLHVMEGHGYVQSRGEELIELHPGDTVYTPRASGIGTVLARTTFSVTSLCGRHPSRPKSPRRNGAICSLSRSTPHDLDPARARQNRRGI